MIPWAQTNCDSFVCANNTWSKLSHLMKRVIAQIRDKCIYTKYQL